MSKCSKYEEMISAYVDGELTSAEETELTAHLNDCEQCRALLEAYINIGELISENTVEPPAELLLNVMTGISGAKAGRSTSKKSIRRVAMRYLAVAACIAVTIMAVPRVLGGSNSSMPASLTAGLDSEIYDTASDTEENADGAKAEEDSSFFYTSDAVGSSSGTFDSDTGSDNAAAGTSTAADDNDAITAAVTGVAGTENVSPTDSETQSSLTDSSRNTAPALGLKAPQASPENGSDASGVSDSTADSGASSGTAYDTVPSTTSNENDLKTGYESCLQVNDVLFTDSNYAGIITVNGSLPKVLDSSELYVNGNGIYRIYVNKYTALDLVRTGYDFILNDSPKSEEFVVIYTVAG
ncbi:MAG: zf-HC2 domain-containing protein [Oscillospiraceae bacterium]